MRCKSFAFEMTCAICLFLAVWKTRDEDANFTQKHDIELIREDKRKVVEEEIRVQVDELMREELKQLKAVFFTLS